MPSPFAEHWLLDPAVDFLNHGSFGACPRVVLEAAQRASERFEREPVRFYLHELEAGLDAARNAVAALFGAEPADLVFVANASTGVNSVLASLELEPGDEVLVTNQTYGACRNAAEFWAARLGAHVVRAELPFPVRGPEQVTEAVLASVTPRTRYALLDHVTSPTAIVLPIAELVQELRARGIATLIDGAHAPGMLPLDVPGLGVDYYAGNLHKWCCTPKGVGVLWVRRELQSRVRPLVISHGMTSQRTDRSRFLLEFDWVGTEDVGAVFAVPAALAFLEQVVPGGRREVMRHNHELAVSARRVLLDALGLDEPCPESMLGSMAALPLPDEREPRNDQRSPFAEPLYSKLVAHGFDVPIFPFPAPPKQVLRISAQLYNHSAQYERLARVLAGELGRSA